jgi:hypothetical protein
MALEKNNLARQEGQEIKTVSNEKPEEKNFFGKMWDKLKNSFKSREEARGVVQETMTMLTSEGAKQENLVQQEISENIKRAQEIDPDVNVQALKNLSEKATELYVEMLQKEKAMEQRIIELVNGTGAPATVEEIDVAHQLSQTAADMFGGTPSSDAKKKTRIDRARVLLHKKVDDELDAIACGLTHLAYTREY